MGEFFDEPHPLVNHGLDAADAGRRFADDGEIAACEGVAKISAATLQAFPLGDGGAGGGFFVRVGVAQDFDIVFAAFDDFAAVGLFAFGGLALGFGGVGLLRALFDVYRLFLGLAVVMPFGGDAGVLVGVIDRKIMLIAAGAGDDDRWDVHAGYRCGRALGDKNQIAVFDRAQCVVFLGQLGDEV